MTRTPRAAARNGESNSAEAIRVLVVEDHPATARGVKIFLEISGMAVEIVTNMRQALRVGGRRNFDVLLCDLHLPDGTGWELMEALTKDGPLAAVAFSAYDEPEHIARSHAVGFAEDLAKGVAPEDLVAVIKRVAAATSAAA